MQCNTAYSDLKNTYRYTKGLIYDSIDWRKGADWVKWPKDKPYVSNVDIRISQQSKILDYGGKSVTKYKITSPDYWKVGSELRKKFPVGSIEIVTTTIDFELFTRRALRVWTAPNGYSVTDDDIYRCYDIKK